jgi:uncharacterized phage protein (TIGR01671 family)
MREIKFRAWEPERKRMSEAFNLKDLDGEDGGEIYTGDMSLIQINHNPTVILMQYTGLKDKHGKEIYEGDIVKILKPLTHGWCPVLVEVQYSAPEFCVDYGHSNGLHSACEVIGNIYENPELLGAK